MTAARKAAGLGLDTELYSLANPTLGFPETDITHKLQFKGLKVARVSTLAVLETSW